MSSIRVTKRDGTQEPLDFEKFHRVVSWACEGLTGVSASEIEIQSQVQFYDLIKTSDIHETLINAASKLITEDTPNYQYVASRLSNFALRKMVYGNYEPFPLDQHISNVIEVGYYDKDILSWYNKAELAWLDKQIDHDRDYNIVFAGMEQYRGKYLIKNRVTKEFYETPQMAIMLISMVLFRNYQKETRLKWVKDFYDAVSNFEISLPTPIMAGLRSPQKQFSSCVVVETDDSLDSINATVSSIVKYVSQKAGIGIGAGRIRAIDSPVRGGDTTHTGAIPFYRLFQAAVKSCSQGGVRGGSATLHCPIWHLDINDLLVLKNNKGTEFNRVRQLDYCFQFNKVMYERLLNNGHITLFSPHDVKDMYDAFFVDVDKFRELYEKAEKDPNIRKKVISAKELFSNFMQERKDTGRVYLMNVDHANDHGSFINEIAPIRQSNLCQEINLPTKPLNDINDEDGEISLCTLAAINWGKIKEPKDFERLCKLVVCAINELLDYQDYPVKAAYKSTMNRRPLGIGVINFAYWLAKNDLSYSNITPAGLAKIHEYAEAWSYYLIKASADLAEERGACPLFNETKYSQGLLPIHTYKKTVDELAHPVYKMDWDGLIQQILRTGLLNSTLMAGMPAETSAQISNSTNGFEPVRSLVTIKGSKDAYVKQVVPEIRKLKHKYDLLWDQKSPEGYLKIMAVMQKFMDQGISVNTSYNPELFENGKIPMTRLISDLVMFYYYGGKQLYYFNTFDDAGDDGEKILVKQEESSPLPDEDDCSSCKI